MPQMNANSAGGSAQNKKKFEVEHEQIVQEEDQEYEESKSHLGSRNKTLEHKDKEDEEEYVWQQSESKVKNKQSRVSEGKEEEKQNRQTKPQTGTHEEQVYEQSFEDREI